MTHQGWRFRDKKEDPVGAGDWDKGIHRFSCNPKQTKDCYIMEKRTCISRLIRATVVTSILALSSGAGFCASAPYAAMVEGDGALAYYRFSDSLTRDNVNLNSGSIGAAGNATNTYNLRAFAGAIVGDGNKSQFFDTGTAYAMIPYNAAMNPDNTKPFTLEAWFYPASDQINGGQCTINNRLAGSAPDRMGWVMFQRAPDDSYNGKGGFEGVGWNFRMYRGSGGSSGLDVVSQVPYDIGKWTHVAVVYDPVDPVTNANLIIYVNGVAANTNTWTGGDSGTDPGYVAAAPGTDVAMSFGAYNNTSGAGGNPYFGGIDEFAFYAVKLTPEQILAHYQSGTNASRATPYVSLVQSANPVTYLRFNENTPGAKVAVNMGDVRAAGNATHTPEVRYPAAAALTGRMDDGAAAYHNRNGNSTTTIPFLAENNPDSGVPFTFETWLRPMRDQQGGQCPVNNRWVGGTGRTGWVIFQRNPNLSYPASEGHGWVFRMFTGNGTSGHDVITDTDYTIGEWSHLVVTWEPQQDNGDPGGNLNHQSQGILTAYFNGLAVASNTAALYAANLATTETGAAASDLAIGSYNAASGIGNNAFEGDVDELAIYSNYLLTPEQILAHYMAGTNSHPATNYETLVLNAANDGTAQRLMPKTYLRFSEAAYFPAANSGSIGAGADGDLVLTTNNAAGPTNAGFESSNMAIPLDGARSWASLNNPVGLNISGQISLEAWIKPDATQGAVARIVSHGPPTLSSFLAQDPPLETNVASTVAHEVALTIQDTGATYAIGANDGTNFHGVTFAVPAGDLGGGQWIYLVGTYDGSKWTLFRNGLQVASANDTIGALTVDDADWAIGSTGNGWADNFAGAIDEVAIYGKALSAAQVQAHYSATADRPRLDITRDAQGQLTITWDTGTLQQADDAAGLYTDVPNNPTSPYLVPTGPLMKFYRLRL